MELANDSMSEQMDDMATKLCFCGHTEGAQVSVMMRLSSQLIITFQQVAHSDLVVEVSDDKSLYATYHTPPVVGQPDPEAPMDVPLVIPLLQLDRAKTCCPGCKDLDLSQVPLIPVETLMRNPFDVNQGRAAHHQGVRTGQ